MKIKRGKMDGSRITLRGGPWDKKIVFIPNSGTLIFSINSYHGLYKSDGVWVDLDGQS